MITLARIGRIIWIIQIIKSAMNMTSDMAYTELFRLCGVGIVPFGLDVPKKPVFMRVSGLGTFRVTVFATDKIVTLGLQLNLKIA